MNFEQYKKESVRTMSTELHVEAYNPADALAGLAHFEYSAQGLDDAKKGLFYGRSPKPWKPEEAMPSQRFETNELHGILGIVTEAAELSTALREAWANPKETDDHKIADELGDLMWYAAILCRERGIDFEKMLDGNIAKLRARFPDKFSSDHALTRNGQAEDAALANAMK